MNRNVPTVYLLVSDWNMENSCPIWLLRQTVTINRTTTSQKHFSMRECRICWKIWQRIIWKCRCCFPWSFPHLWRTCWAVFSAIRFLSWTGSISDRYAVNTRLIRISPENAFQEIPTVS